LIAHEEADGLAIRCPDDGEAPVGVRCQRQDVRRRPADAADIEMVVRGIGIEVLPYERI